LVRDEQLRRVSNGPWLYELFLLALVALSDFRGGDIHIATGDNHRRLHPFVVLNRGETEQKKTKQKKTREQYNTRRCEFPSCITDPVSIGFFECRTGQTVATPGEGGVILPTNATTCAATGD
jgi:hypothetical protein